MGAIRNGARTYLKVMQYACKLSHMPGFRLGLTRILGSDATDSIYTHWTPLCALIELLVASDDHFNQIDALTPSLTGGEDLIVA